MISTAVLYIPQRMVSAVVIPAAIKCDTGTPRMAKAQLYVYIVCAGESEMCYLTNYYTALQDIIGSIE